VFLGKRWAYESTKLFQIFTIVLLFNFYSSKHTVCTLVFVIEAHAITKPSFFTSVWISFKYFFKVLISLKDYETLNVASRLNNSNFYGIPKLQENFDRSMPGMSCQVIRLQFLKDDFFDSEDSEASFRCRQWDSDESNGAKSAGGGRRRRPGPFPPLPFRKSEFSFPFSFSSNNILKFKLNLFITLWQLHYSGKRHVAWQSTDSFDDDNEERNFFFSLSLSLSLSQSLTRPDEYILFSIKASFVFLSLFLFFSPFIYTVFFALIYYVCSASIICLCASLRCVKRFFVDWASLKKTENNFLDSIIFF
jgi:hypothetical protein